MKGQEVHMRIIDLLTNIFKFYAFAFLTKVVLDNLKACP